MRSEHSTKRVHRFSAGSFNEVSFFNSQFPFIYCRPASPSRLSIKKVLRSVIFETCVHPYSVVNIIPVFSTYLVDLKNTNIFR